MTLVRLEDLRSDQVPEPLKLLLISDYNLVDAYIQMVKDGCENEDIALYSKVISINGMGIAGWTFRDIENKLVLEKVPIRMTLVRLEDLRSDQVPDSFVGGKAF